MGLFVLTDYAPDEIFIVCKRSVLLMDDLVSYFSVFYDINYHSLNFTSVNISHFVDCCLLLTICYIVTLVLKGSANFM